MALWLLETVHSYLARILYFLMHPVTLPTITPWMVLWEHIRLMQKMKQAILLPVRVLPIAGKGIYMLPKMLEIHLAAISATAIILHLNSGRLAVNLDPIH